MATKFFEDSSVPDTAGYTVKETIKLPPINKNHLNVEIEGNNKILR
jgi:hypothetical protein